MSTLLIDVETTARGGPDNDSPEAHWPINECLLVGWNDGSGVRTGTPDEFKEWWEPASCHTIVAHNAKFDIKWLMRILDEDLSDCDVYCTMTAEYLKTGHSTKFVTLETLASSYGIKTKKTMDLGTYIDSGGRMEDIPTEDLAEYLKTDVELLGAVYTKQKGTYNIPYVNYILPLAEMELNGLPIDTVVTEELAKAAMDVCDSFTSYIKNKIKINCEWLDGSPITDADFEKKIKPTANRTLSFLLTGCPSQVKTTSDKWTFTYKDGAKTVLAPSTIAKIWTDPPTNLGYKMDEKHIAKVCARLPLHWANKIPEWRKQDKLLNTYYLPFLNKAQFTGCVHPKLNTTATATGRLSSSDPNGQNMPTEARQLVSAPPGYKILELDFSQLELVALAEICRDARMIQDIKDGEDIHYNSGRSVMGWDDPSEMDKDSRKKVKNVNFGAVYGGKPPGLSMQTGIDQKIVKDLIVSLYRRYPGIAKWQKEFYEEVVENMEPNGHDDNGEQMYKSRVTCGGRTYTFKETPSPRWLRARMGRGYSFNPNQVYNYPIQGFAGWAIVLRFLYELWYIVKMNCHDIKFLMTVHDSIILMVPEDIESTVKSCIDCAIVNTSSYLGLSVPLEVNLEYGQTWS